MHHDVYESMSYVWNRFKMEEQWWVSIDLRLHRTLWSYVSVVFPLRMSSIACRCDVVCLDVVVVRQDTGEHRKLHRQCLWVRNHGQFREDRLDLLSGAGSKRMKNGGDKKGEDQRAEGSSRTHFLLRRC